MLYNLLTMLVFAVLAFAFMYIGKKIMDIMVKGSYNPDLEIEKEDNLAIALRRAGFYFGIGFAMTASISATEGLTESLIHQAINGLLILVFLFIAMWISDKVLLSGVDNTKELKNKNVAVGIIEATLYISTSLIAYASFKGEEGPFIASIVFFAMGQLMLILIAKGYGQVHKGLFQKIEEGNVSAGLIVGGVMIAYAIILMTAISGEFVSWEADIIGFLISAIVGMFMLLLFANKVIDNLFLPTSTISQEIEEDNYAAILMIVSLKIAIAFIISTVVI